MMKADYKLHSQGPQREANEAHGKYATNNEVKSINNKSQMSKDIAKIKENIKEKIITKSCLLQEEGGYHGFLTFQ